MSRPNIIYILADDLGIGDLGCYGQRELQTPNLDRMAEEGLRFTQHYSGGSVCAPSRACLMTGLHTGHSRIRGNPGQNVLYKGPFDPPLPTEEITVAELLKTAGYDTACIGKWGLGALATTGHPKKKGFDTFYGYNTHIDAHNYYPEYLWRSETQEPTQGRSSHDILTDKVLSYLANCIPDRPIFLYVPYTVPHGQWNPPTEEPYADRTDWPENCRRYAAMITLLDRDIGRIFETLKISGLDDNTLVMFASDNGCESKYIDYLDSNGPYRGHKGDFYEGGIRVPMIARWPGGIQPASTTDHISSFWDILPTCADLADVNSPVEIDGISMVPTLTGKGRQEKHSHLYWEWRRPDGDHPKQAVRKGDSKLIRFLGENPRLELYNLDDDIGETRDIVKQHPDIVEVLQKLLDDEHVLSEAYPLPRIDDTEGKYSDFK